MHGSYEWRQCAYAVMYIHDSIRTHVARAAQKVKRKLSLSFPHQDALSADRSVAYDSVDCQSTLSRAGREEEASDSAMSYAYGLYTNH